MERALQVCIEMFQERGYENIEADDDRVTALKEDMSNVCAFMVNVEKFNVNRVQECLGIMKDHDISHAVIVYKDVITPMAKKVVETAPTELTVELYREGELFNVTKHKFVPLHEKVDPESADLIKEHYGSNWPILRKSDPVARFYGFVRGDLIKVTRPLRSTGGVGSDIMYRIVH